MALKREFKSLSSRLVAPAIFLASSRRANAKLDFDQKEYENRPDMLDAAPRVDIGTQPDWKKLKAELTDYVVANPNKGPTLVRLAWHSCGTYDKIQKDGHKKALFDSRRSYSMVPMQGWIWQSLGWSLTTRNIIATLI